MNANEHRDSNNSGTGLQKLTRSLGSVWYMCLKTEKCCLKTFVKIRVGEKVR